MSKMTLGQQRKLEREALLENALNSERREGFSLVWFATEREAKRFSTLNRCMGVSVQGGSLDGLPCARAPRFDRVDHNGVVQAYCCRNNPLPHD